jgi:2-polyprenyl-6-methoxyphenol hydroxylase-like FAD-dependent oxidoreductase
MPKVSIMGAGPAGCVLAYALLRDGHQVTLYSDRSPDQWLNHSAPTGTAYLWGETIDIERELGMDYWSHEMFEGHGVLFDLAQQVGDPNPKVMKGRFEYGREGCGIDQRMRVHRWLEDLEQRGGRLVIESVTPSRLDEIALASDVTILAAGKADLANIIPRDAERSDFDKPQRNLSMAIVRSKSGRHVREWFSDRWKHVPTKFDFFADAGEFFWVPYMHKTAGHTFALLFEAKPGGAFDRFNGLKSGEEVTDVATDIMRKHAPWERHFVDDVEYVSEDRHGWLVGRFPPTVRQAFGRLPSGGLVMPVGDTAITFDPICGQGGNFANRSAKFIADQITAHTGKFDEVWMTKVNYLLWSAYGRNQCYLNNTFLRPLSPSAQLVVDTACSNDDAGDAFYYGFPHPETMVPALSDMNVANAFAAQHGYRARRAA